MNNVLHGWLLLDKPEGITSARALSKIKHHFGIKKLGHAGTLDPFATGVLPIALNEATKTAGYVVATRKGYIFKVQWGEDRDTYDREGQVIETSSVRPHRQSIEAALLAFQGDIMQTPPRYAALKIDGVPAYKRARKGESFDMTARMIHVSSFKCIENTQDDATFEVTCGKGTYVRSLAYDLAKKLGACGHVTYLRRTFVGGFHEKNTISLANLLEIRYLSQIGQWVHPIGNVLDDILAISIEDKDVCCLRKGLPVTLSNAVPDTNVAYAHSVCGRPVALVKIQANTMRSVRVFNIEEN